MSILRFRLLPRHLIAVLFLLALSGCVAEPTLKKPAAAGRQAVGEEIVVYRSATCECCKGHIAHLEESGFAVRDEIVEDIAGVKARLGVPDDMQSCHTGVVGDYFVEGHVPADVIAGLIDDRPDVDGIALPGMPSGAPGMPGEPDTLTVMAVTDGHGAVYEVR